MIHEGPLGRLEPPNYNHVEKYPMAALGAEIPKGTPVEFGIPWYSNFDNPQKDASGRYWIGKGALGSIRGGHAIVSPPANIGDVLAWWYFYNQGNTGECVGFSLSRMMSLFNRAKFDAPWLYFATQDRAGQARDPQAGTYVNVGFEVLLYTGHKTLAKPSPSPANGINAFRWFQSVDEIRAAHASPKYDDLGGIPFLNSWGQFYPRVVWMPYETVAAVLDQGEAGAATDK